MLFDLTNTSTIFQVYINHVLHDLVDNFCIVYFDNILVFSKSEEKHYKHLELVIKCFQHAKLYTNFKKYEFFKKKIKYFNFFINKNNLCMNFFYIKTIFD